MSASATIPPTASVAVLGGGLAGLAAAVTLARAGADVQLLEARQRVGGRVLTIREPFADGLYAEGGGEFISPGHDTVRRFVCDYGLVARPRGFGARTLYFGGQMQRGLTLEAYGDCARQDGERLAAALAALGERVPDPHQAWTAPGAAELDRCSLAQWLDQLELHPLTRAQQEVWTTIDYGVEARELSLLMVARDERLIALSPERPVECVRGGIDRLPQAMAAELGARVHLGTAATATRQDGGRVWVDYEQEGRGGTLAAEYVVVALPFTTVRSIRFEPALAAEQHEAIQRLRYGHVLKTLLQFRQRFWRDLQVGGFQTDLPINAGYDGTHDQPGERGILTVYTAGASAAALAQLSEPERLEQVLRQLEQIYPGCRNGLETAVSVVWDAEPFGRGAYSHFGPGELRRFGPLLAQPSGRLHFAGEHTDAWQATMNGALASGVRAAHEVLTRNSRQ